MPKKMSDPLIDAIRGYRQYRQACRDAENFKRKNDALVLNLSPKDLVSYKSHTREIDQEDIDV